MKSIKELKKSFTRQHGEFACGLACLNMIIKYHGGNARQEDLRNISGTSLQGTTLLGLYQAAEKLHFTPEAYEADLDSLKSLKPPIVLHIIKNQKIEHYIVCFGFENNKFIIGDPGENSISFLSEQELNAIWQSKALLTLEPTSDFVRKDSEKKEKRNWLKNLVKEDISILTVAFILGMIIAVLGLATAVFSQKLIDDLLPSKNYEKIVLGILFFFILLIARSGLDFLRSIFALRQTRGMNNRLIDRFFSKILYLPKSFFDSTKTGEIITRMSDSRRIQQTLLYIVGSVLIEALTLLFAIGYLLFYSRQMALIALACIPFFILLVILYNQKIIDGQRNVMVSNAATEGLLIDFIQGVNDIKNANKQPAFKQSIQVMYGLLQQFGYKLGVLGSQYGLIAQVISTVTSVSLIIFGVFQVLNEQLTLGELMAVMTISSIIISSTASLSGVNIRLQEAGVAFDRFYEFLKAKPEFEPDEEVLGTKVHGARDEGHVCLQIKDLSFRFIGRKKLFEHISMEINQGEIVTLFGEVGSGKSTLIQILQKHYLPESGEIFLNNKSITEYSTPLWREYVSVVSQHTKIFNGNVFENICLGNYMNETETIIRFCKEYGFDTYFDALPQGLNTLLGEDGINISGGQQQLIALARALYRNPSVLLLDEPTSAMDSKTEQFVMDLLKKHKTQYSILLVTHRTHWAEISDRIYRFGSFN
ncbi:MAG: peptidase domain-containing ABC transporter [Dysgonamonadaceae bacterium]|jgi:ATP-binding cassette subfamily B protein|nr:peptidase domain-containing ABC transporter [Dysgonamonadaceae bacterium]